MITCSTPDSFNFQLIRSMIPAASETSPSSSIGFPQQSYTTPTSYFANSSTNLSVVFGKKDGKLHPVKKLLSFLNGGNLQIYTDSFLRAVRHMNYQEASHLRLQPIFSDCQVQSLFHQFLLDRHTRRFHTRNNDMPAPVFF